MKKIIAGILCALSMTASAHTIEGVLILKGKIKTKVTVEGVKSTCTVKVDKVKNLLEEDSYGNPAYNVKVEVNLSGSEKVGNRRVTVAYDRAIWFNNLFSDGRNSEVKDLEYHADGGAKMNIDKGGRIKQVSFQYNRKQVTCAF
jgi:hypothetical protein